MRPRYEAQNKVPGKRWETTIGQGHSWKFKERCAILVETTARPRIEERFKMWLMTNNGLADQYKHQTFLPDIHTFWLDQYGIGTFQHLTESKFSMFYQIWKSDNSEVFHEKFLLDPPIFSSILSFPVFSEIERWKQMLINNCAAPGGGFEGDSQPQPRKLRYLQPSAQGGYIWTLPHNSKSIYF